MRACGWHESCQDSEAAQWHCVLTRESYQGPKISPDKEDRISSFIPQGIARLCDTRHKCLNPSSLVGCIYTAVDNLWHIGERLWNTFLHLTNTTALHTEWRPVTSHSPVVWHPHIAPATDLVGNERITPIFRDSWHLRLCLSSLLE